MRELEILRRLPEGFVARRDRRGAFAASADLAERLELAGLGLEAPREVEPSDAFGREPLGQVEIDGTRFLVRRFHHGGLLRWLTGARFLDPERPFRELALAHELRARCIATPRVVAARALALPAGGFALDLVSERVEDALDLGALLAERRRGEVGDRAWRATWRAAGSLVARLHAIGVAHADLTPRNLLVERASLASAKPRLWVIDLDRSRLEPELDLERRRANLRRLHRHVARLRLEGHADFTVADLARFLIGYRPERVARHEDWRAIEREHARRAPLHSTGWMLERRFGGRRSDVR